MELLFICVMLRNLLDWSSKTNLTVTCLQKFVNNMRALWSRSAKVRHSHHIIAQQYKYATPVNAWPKLPQPMTNAWSSSNRKGFNASVGTLLLLSIKPAISVFDNVADTKRDHALVQKETVESATAAPRGERQWMVPRWHNTIRFRVLFDRTSLVRHKNL